MEIIVGQSQKSRARVSDSLILIRNRVCPSLDYFIIILPFYTLKSVKRKALVCLRIVFFKTIFKKDQFGKDQFSLLSNIYFFFSVLQHPLQFLLRQYRE